MLVSNFEICRVGKDQSLKPYSHGVNEDFLFDLFGFCSF